ncbi:MAG: hypothetical protein ACXVLQ_00665 [Bacteriovorax sp.]
MTQELNFTNVGKRHCVHTKHIYSMLDMSKKDEAYKRLSRHIETCPVCARELQNFQHKSMAAQVFIPKISMDRDLRQSFEREVGELFKVMNLNEREQLKRNVKKGFRFIDALGVDFLKNLASKTMLKAYVLAVFIFIGLKVFFS